MSSRAKASAQRPELPKHSPRGDDTGRSASGLIKAGGKASAAPPKHAGGQEDLHQGDPLNEDGQHQLPRQKAAAGVAYKFSFAAPGASHLLKGLSAAPGGAGADADPYSLATMELPP